MEQEGKVRQITKNEAKEIDPKKVAYFTLNDGTVFIVKDNVNQQSQNVQEQEQIQTTSENNIQTQSQNTQEVQQIESNYAYNVLGEGENMNARLVNARIVGQVQGQRRQLYKLIEAIPVRFTDVQGIHFMNQSNNIQLNLQQYNNETYVVEKSNRDVSSSYQVNTLSSGKVCTCGGKIETKCCCPIGNPAMREKYEIINPEEAEKYQKKKECSTKKE